MATWTAFDTVGKKEDISDVISNISPTETPFTMATAEEKVDNTIFQWQEDELAAVNTSNALVQGADASDTTPTATTMRSNYTQILGKTVKVAGTTDAVSHYGRAKELAYQLGKYSKEVKRDLEAIMLSSQTASAGNSSTAANMAGFGAQVDAGLLYLTGAGVTPGTATTGDPMSETELVTALEDLYSNGADPSVMTIPPNEATVVAAFASASGRYRTIDTSDPKASKKLVNTVNIYVSPFGEIRISLNRFQPVIDYLIFDPSMWKRAVLRPWSRVTLAKTGDATKMQIIGEFSLKHKNRDAAAIVRKYLA